MHPSRPHPHVAIPSSSSHNPPVITDPWNFYVTPPESRGPNDPFADTGRYPAFVSSPPPSTARPVQKSFSSVDPSDRPPSRASSDSGSTTRFPFPEPQIYHSVSQTIPRPASTNSTRPSFNQTHRNTKSEVLLSPAPVTAHPDSRASSVTAYSDESSPELTPKDLSEELSDQTLQSEEGLRRFQSGDLSPNEEQWYLLVPPEARQVLSKQEITRQSIIFELIQNERDYVRDLELLSEAFIDPMRNVKPIPSPRVESFIKEVFSNLNTIKAHHESMLADLFARQRDQHPLVSSIAEIVLDSVLRFTPDYKAYIENYPIAEAQHLIEYRRNPKYQFFISQCSQDPRMRKREFNSLLIRPVTHLPRLQLLLETMKKHTALEHEDQDTIPVASGVLKDFIKSAERGIQSAREKVKYWELCESLAFTHGEGMFKQALDLYDEHRSIHRAGPLARKADKDVGTTWWDLHVALLDHYLLLLKPEKEKRTGNMRNNVVSRPIPLEYLRLDSFDKPPDSRKERSSSSEHATSRSLPFTSIQIQRSKYRSVYPFTVHHVSGKSYTLYAQSENEREGWKRDLENAIALRKVVVDGNKFFASNTISEGYFRIAPNVVLSNSRTKYTGKITCVTPLQGGEGRDLIVVGTSSGVYVAPKGTSDFHKILQLPNVKYLQTLTEYNKFLVHSDMGLQAWSLNLLIRVALREAPPQPLDASLETLSPENSVVVFVQVGLVKINGEIKMLVMFATKHLLQLTVHQYEVLRPDKIAPSSGSGVVMFVPYGAPATISKDTYGLTSMSSYVGFCTSAGILVAEPARLATTTYKRRIIPEFSASESDPEVQVLRSKCLGAKPLGLVKNTNGEMLLVYDDLGCYLNTKGEPMHGTPGRESGYLRWESKATSYASRGPHLLLFSPNYIEIRTINEGRLVQVIEGEDIRLVHAGERGIFIARKGTERAGGGAGAGGVEVLVELVETKPFEDVKPAPEEMVLKGDVGLWDEWDM